MRFVQDAVCFPIEPCNLRFMWKQLRRWSHGFVQNVRLHFRGLLGVPYLRSLVTVVFCDAAFAAVVYLTILPLLVVLVHPLFLLGYVIHAPAILVPVLVAAVPRREALKVLDRLPFERKRSLDAPLRAEGVAGAASRPTTMAERRSGA